MCGNSGSNGRGGEGCASERKYILPEYRIVRVTLFFILSKLLFIQWSFGNIS
jgi:hypothetical protein